MFLFTSNLLLAPTATLADEQIDKQTQSTKGLHPTIRTRQLTQPSASPNGSYLNFSRLKFRYHGQDV